jgi:hypothetical protein
MGLRFARGPGGFPRSRAAAYAHAADLPYLGSPGPAPLSAGSRGLPGASCSQSLNQEPCASPRSLTGQRSAFAIIQAVILSNSASSCGRMRLRLFPVYSGTFQPFRHRRTHSAHPMQYGSPSITGCRPSISFPHPRHSRPSTFRSPRPASYPSAARDHRNGVHLQPSQSDHLFAQSDH